MEYREKTKPRIEVLISEDQETRTTAEFKGNGVLVHRLWRTNNDRRSLFIKYSDLEKIWERGKRMWQVLEERC